MGSLDFGFWGRNPKSKIQNPQSKLFWPNFGDFGCWILDRYVAILYVRPQPPHILDFGGDFEFWILEVGDSGFWILGILDFGDFGFWILGMLDFGIFGILGILDFGFLEHYVADLYVQSLDFGDFGFWILGILDFGFWGFWILDLGDFLSLGDWGFWI